MNGCVLGSAGRMMRRIPAASSATGRGVRHGAEDEAERVRERLPHLAACPVEVEDAREEGREGDQAEAQKVPVTLFELRQGELRPPGPAGTASLAAAARHPR